MAGDLIDLGLIQGLSSSKVRSHDEVSTVMRERPHLVG
jgi:hypothetical protein